MKNAGLPFFFPLLAWRPGASSLGRLLPTRSSTVLGEVHPMYQEPRSSWGRRSIAGTKSIAEALRAHVGRPTGSWTLISSGQFHNLQTPLLPEKVVGAIHPGRATCRTPIGTDDSSAAMSGHGPGHRDRYGQSRCVLSRRRAPGPFATTSSSWHAGANANLDIVEGYGQLRPPPEKTLGDALFLRNRIHFEDWSRRSCNPTVKHRPPGS